MPKSPNDNSRCIVLVPVGSNMDPECDYALRMLERRGYVVNRMWGYSAIDQGRNHMATDALAQGYEELMWIDSDIGFNPDDVDRLRAHGLPIVCGIYAKRGSRDVAYDPLPGTKQVTFGLSGGLIEIAYGATGFLYTHASVYGDIFTQLKLPVCNQRYNYAVVPYFLPMVVEDEQLPGCYRYLGEDFSFLHRAKQCGYRVMADTRIRLKHFGRYPHQWEDAGSELPRYDVFHLELRQPSGLAAKEQKTSLSKDQRAPDVVAGPNGQPLREEAQEKAVQRRTRRKIR